MRAKILVIFAVLSFFFVGVGFCSDVLVTCTAPGQTYYAAIFNITPSSANYGKYLDISAGTWGSSAVYNAATEKSPQTYQVTLSSGALSTHERFLAVFYDGNTGTPNLVGISKRCFRCGQSELDRYGCSLQE